MGTVLTLEVSRKVGFGVVLCYDTTGLPCVMG